MFDNAFTSQQWTTPLSDTTELSGWANRPFQATWPEGNDTLTNKIVTKKNKRIRTAYTNHQILALEGMYKKSKYLRAKERSKLANLLNVRERCIKVWFQNRRCKEKRQLSRCSSANSSTPGSPTEALPPETVATDVQHQYPQIYICPTQIENSYDASAHNPYSYYGTEVSYNYLSGYEYPHYTSISPPLPDDTSISPTRPVETSTYPIRPDDTSIYPTRIDDTSIYPTRTDDTSIFPTLTDDTSIYPIQTDNTNIDPTLPENYPGSTAYYPYTRTAQYHNLMNTYGNGNDCLTDLELNIN